METESKMRKNVLFIAKFDNVLKGMNKILAKSFNMQMCPPDPAMVDKMLGVMEIDLILLYLSGVPTLLLTGICANLRTEGVLTPVIVFGTSEECTEFYKNCPIVISKYLHRPLTAHDIARAIGNLLSVDPADPKSRITKNMSLADLAESLETDNRRCILLVDDDGRILRAIKLLLEDTYRINIANSGMSALESIERERPDAVLLDYEMPVFDGKQTLELIRKNESTKDLPVFFLTGVSDKERVTELLHLKPQGYLLKSSEQSAIIGMLEKYFKETGI